MKRLNTKLLLLALALTTNIANSQTLNKLIPFASGLTKPVAITHAGDSRLFVIDQNGYIRIISSNGVVNTIPYLDITGRIVYGGERGLLGIVFHPKYKTTGYFYVNYTGIGDSTYISRFKVSAVDPNVADPQSELKLMTIFQPYQNHNGGDLKFGPDGYLYIGLGDGGSSGDPGNRAQNPKELLGKMLRIDIDQETPYSVPNTNPFYNSTTKPEIWALGLRNPWRFSFDRLTGDLWIADVGQNAIEEINFQSSASKGGENYGWRCYEGNQIYNATGCVETSSLTFPVYTYPQGSECSVTGGFVYRGASDSPFYGHYFFADYCSDKIWTLHKASGNWVKENFGTFTGNNFSTFGEDVNGQLYVAGITSGKIFRIEDQVTRNVLLDKSQKINITQIPQTKRIHIQALQNNLNIVQLSIFDILGREQYKITRKDADFEIDFEFLKSGIYFLKVSNDGKSQTKKLIL